MTHTNEYNEMMMNWLVHIMLHFEFKGADNNGVHP